MKECTKCKIVKDESEFYARRTAGKSGLDSRCKVCRRRTVKENYSLERNRKTKNKNRADWVKFFNQYYGSNPECSVCHKKLNWIHIGNKSEAVHWDHQHGKNNLDYSPSDWYPSHLCNEENQAIWLEFDFGILCHNCNKSLPTDNREQWVKNVINYVFGKNYGLLKLEQVELSPLDWEY